METVAKQDNVNAYLQAQSQFQISTAISADMCEEEAASLRDIVMFCEQSLMQNKMDKLLAELEPLELALDAILSSRLTEQCKKSLDALHGQIGQHFDQQSRSAQDNDAIEVALDKIDSILNQSYDALSDIDKQQVQLIKSNIDDVFEAMEPHSAAISRYLAS